MAAIRYSQVRTDARVLSWRWRAFHARSGRVMVSLESMRERLERRGFRNLARKHWRMGIRELRGSFSKAAYAAEAARYVPAVTPDDLVPAHAGVRAQALDPDGSLVDDFRIHRLGPITAVRNAPSPGATSSMAIAEHIADAALSPT